MRHRIQTSGPLASLSLATLLLTGCTHAVAQTTQPATDPADAAAMVPATEPVAAGPYTGTLTANSPIDHVLIALEQRGKDLKTLYFGVKKSEANVGLGGGTTLTGRFWLMNDPNAGSRLRVVFDKKVQGRKMIDVKKEYVIDGQNLIEHDFDEKIENVRQFLKPGQKMNILKLGEGLFPLPIGQDPAEVKKQFTVEFFKPIGVSPPNTLPVRMTPLPDSDFSRKYSTIDCWVDLASHMPIRIEATDVNQVTVQKIDITDAKFNEGVAPADVQPEKVDMKDWKRNSGTMQ